MANKKKIYTQREIKAFFQSLTPEQIAAQDALIAQAEATKGFKVPKYIPPPVFRPIRQVPDDELDPAWRGIVKIKKKQEPKRTQSPKPVENIRVTYRDHVDIEGRRWVVEERR